MWLVLGIIIALFLSFVGWILIYAGTAHEGDDIDRDCDECWDCSHCDRMFGICKLTNAHVIKGQKCNLSEELEKLKKKANQKK